LIWNIDCGEGAPSGFDLAAPVNQRLAPVSTPMLAGAFHWRGGSLGSHTRLANW